MDNWYHNNIGRGDNFIARIGIKPDSGLITYYCNNRYRTDSTAFKKFSRSNTRSCSWRMGRIFIGVGELATDEAMDMLDATTDFPQPTNTPCW